MKQILAAFAILLVSAVPARAQQLGTCSTPNADAFLDVNNVRARIKNDGNLWGDNPYVYNVPKGSSANAIYAGGIWIAGQVNGTIKMAASTYGPFEYWAGPLDESGSVPGDCGKFDHLYKVSKKDVAAYEAGAGAVPDLLNWPTGLGAPTIDADGHDIDLSAAPLASRVDRKIDLANGERPKFLGDQMIWWVMNDMGNTHTRTLSDPIGVEVHGLAFAFDQPGHIGNTTFYQYDIIYKGRAPLTEAYMSVYSDVDMGDFGDDYGGSSPAEGVGYVWNADNFDGGSSGYGIPPAVGYDFFQGPIVPSPGDVAKVGGREIPDFKNLGMTTFLVYGNGGALQSDPNTQSDFYNYMQGKWKDGSPITRGGTGLGFSTEETKFMYDGDAVNCGYWTECNTDGNGSFSAFGDRRITLTTGPFTINPGDKQQIAFGIVWAQGTDRFDSVAKMLDADRLAQAAYDVNFKLPDSPTAPVVTPTVGDRSVILEWENPANGNNYLESYNQLDPFAPPGSYFTFQGYEVIQYADQADQNGVVIATYDVNDGVKRIIDSSVAGQVSTIAADGKDLGSQTYHAVGGLNNYSDYYFGVRVYAYSANSNPQVFKSVTTRVTVNPGPPDANVSELTEALASDGTAISFEKSATNIGQGVVTAKVVNPVAVKNAVYKVRFYEHPTATARRADPVEISALDPFESTEDQLTARKVQTDPLCITYDVLRDEDVVFDGRSLDTCAPQRANVLIIDGLQFSITGPSPGLASILMVSNAAGPMNPPDCAFFGAGFGTTYPFTCEGGNETYPSGSRQGVSFGGFGVHVGGGDWGDYDQFISRSTGFYGSGSLADLGVYDYEIRFTQRGGKAFLNNTIPGGPFIDVPYEVWRIGIATPDDSSDDVRLVSRIADGQNCAADGVFNMCGDSPLSSSNNDPFTDWIYWLVPGNESPGEAGYNEVMAGGGSVTGIFARQIIMGWNQGVAPNLNIPFPLPGMTFRYTTLKPNYNGDVFSIDTGAYDADGDGTPDMLGAVAKDYVNNADDIQDLIDHIGIVPNPYRGASSYERTQLVDEVRFTGLPENATIRIFTLNGTLMRTLEKRGTGSTLAWDLTTDNLLPIASGMYLIHVELDNNRSKVLKFAVIKKRVHLNVF